MKRYWLYSIVTIALVFLMSEVAYGDTPATWRVTRNVVIGSSGFTNSLTTTKEQVSGLPQGIKSRTICIFPDGITSFKEVSFDSETFIETETYQTDVKSPIVTQRKFGKEIEVSSADGKLKNEYDAYGRVTKVLYANADTDEFYPIHRMSYNQYGDLEKQETFISDSETAIECYGYDFFGNQVTITDALGNVANCSYDPFGHITSTGGAAMPLKYNYDSRGLRTAIFTTRDGLAWDGTHWKLDRTTQKCTEKRRADGATTHYEYTPDGLVTKITYPDQSTKISLYNNQRKISQISYSDGTVIQYDYDEFGMPTRVVDASGTIYEYSYGLNSIKTYEVVRKQNTTSEIIRHYDSFSRPTNIVHVINGIIQSNIEFSYNNMNRIEGIMISDSSNKTYHISYTYLGGYNCGYAISNPSASIIQQQLVRDKYRKELISKISTTTRNGQLSFEYKYDALGRIILRNQDSFAYDKRGQIVSSYVGNSDFRYDWDEAGNLRTASINNTTNSFAANCLNQYSSLNKNGEAISLLYHLNGGLQDDGINTYSYDIENRLVSVIPKSVTNGSIKISYTYDYSSRRSSSETQIYDANIAKWATLERRDFFYDERNLIQENITQFSNNTTNTYSNKYFWGIDLSGTTTGGGGVGALLCVSRNGECYFPLYDNLGNIQGYVDESGSTVATYTYSPFGMCISSTGQLSSDFSFRYSTKYFENSTGLYYFDYRYYNPSLMRWMTPDPSEEYGSGNLYTFCNNAPIYSFDPNGLIRIPFITDQAKAAWENVIREVLDRRGWNVAALLMRHSLKRSPNDLSFGEGSLIVSKIKSSPEYRRQIENIIAKQNEPFKVYNSSFVLYYRSGDLFAGIGHATVYYSGTICKTRGKLTVDFNITVKDRYDFHFLTGYNKSSIDGVLAIVANNMAWSDQYFDVITPYSWEAKFKERR